MLKLLLSSEDTGLSTNCDDEALRKKNVSLFKRSEVPLSFSSFVHLRTYWGLSHLLTRKRACVGTCDWFNLDFGPLGLQNSEKWMFEVWATPRPFYFTIIGTDWRDHLPKTFLWRFSAALPLKSEASPLLCVSYRVGQMCLAQSSVCAVNRT